MPMGDGRYLMLDAAQAETNKDHCFNRRSDYQNSKQIDLKNGLIMVQIDLRLYQTKATRAGTTFKRS